MLNPNTKVPVLTTDVTSAEDGCFPRALATRRSGHFEMVTMEKPGVGGASTLATSTREHVAHPSWTVSSLHY